MEELLRQALANTHGVGAYALVFAVLVACGLGVPMPEDVSLILGGFLAYKQAVNFPTMAAVGFAGILVGDSLIYLAGRRLGVGVLHGLLARVITLEKRQRVEQLFRKHGQKIILLARFLPGVRAVTYFTAGSARMGYLRFIAFDGLAAMASAPLLVFLGYKLGDRLEWAIDRFRHGQFAALIGLALVGTGYFLIKRRRKTPAPPQTPALNPGARDELG